MSSAEYIEDYPGATQRVFSSPADAFKIGIGYFLALAVALFCLYVAIFKGPDGTRHIQVLLCMLGGTLGWILGLYLTPSNEGEQKKFTDFGKALVALVSGFGLGKLETLMSWVQEAATGFDQQVALLRGLLFVCSLLVFALCTYVSRLHVRGPEEARRTSREKAVKEIEQALAKLKTLG